MSATHLPELTPVESERLHRRQVFRQIILPLVGAGVVLVALVGAAVALLFALEGPVQLRAVADLLTILCILLPLVLFFLPTYIILMIAAFGTGAFHNFSARRLRQLNRFTRTITDRTITMTDAVDRRVLRARVRLAGVEHFMEHAFDGKDSQQAVERDTDDDPTATPTEI